jgi:hypothetical protein
MQNECADAGGIEKKAFTIIQSVPRTKETLFMNRCPFYLEQDQT